jgi:hypothetical protein
MFIFRWLNPSDPSPDPKDITYDSALNILDSEFEFVILEFRDAFGTGIKFIEPESETKTIDLNLVFRQQQLPQNCKSSFEIVAVNSNGTIFKTKL